MSQNFQPGTITKKTTAEVFDLLKTSAKSEWKIDVADIRSVLDSSEDLIGFEFVHAEPPPRATRKDKGTTRPKKEAQIDSKPADKPVKSSPKSPFNTTDQKAAS